MADAGRLKRVWRIAFFSRLEERKGIKLFVDALNMLDSKSLAHSQVRQPSQNATCHPTETRRKEPSQFDVLYGGAYQTRVRCCILCRLQIQATGRKRHGTTQLRPGGLYLSRRQGRAVLGEPSSWIPGKKKSWRCAHLFTSVSSI